MLRLTFRRSLVLFLIPVALAYLVIPLCVSVSMHEGGPERGLQTFVYAIQVFLPMGALQWAMAYLQVWIDSDGQEAMRACRAGKKSRVRDLSILLLCFFVMLLPGAAYSARFFGFQWKEYARVIVETVFSVSVLYAVSVLLNSVTMGGMMVILYLLFCAFFSDDVVIRRFSMVKAQVLPDLEALLHGYGGIGFAAVLLFAAGAFLEKQGSRWNR